MLFFDCGFIRRLLFKGKLQSDWIVDFKSAFWKILDVDSCNRHTKALNSQFPDF
jgi:hypothetical protein